MAQFSGVRCTRIEGMACAEQSAINAAKSQVVDRVFTGLSMP